MEKKRVSLQLKFNYFCGITICVVAYLDSSPLSQTRSNPGNQGSYDVKSHDVVIRKLRKLRKKQLRDGIPWKTSMSKSASESDRIIITKKKRKRKDNQDSLKVRYECLILPGPLKEWKHGDSSLRQLRTDDS